MIGIGVPRVGQDQRAKDPRSLLHLPRGLGNDGEGGAAT